MILFFYVAYTNNITSTREELKEIKVNGMNELLFFIHIFLSYIFFHIFFYKLLIIESITYMRKIFHLKIYSIKSNFNKKIYIFLNC